MLFADIMIRNSHTRKQTPVPKPPYNPMIESIGIGYSAEEEYFFNGDTPRDRCRIYHIHPLRQKELHEIDLRHPFPMVEVPTEDGIILFGIGNSIGNDQIRLFFEMAALKREIGKEYLPCVQWSFFNGKQWEFIDFGELSQCYLLVIPRQYSPVPMGHLLGDPEPHILWRFRRTSSFSGYDLVNIRKSRHTFLEHTRQYSRVENIPR